MTIENRFIATLKTLKGVFENSVAVSSFLSFTFDSRGDLNVCL